MTPAPPLPSDEILVQLLAVEYPAVPVKTEWRTDNGRGHYSPRIDVAVFLSALHACHRENVRQLDAADEVADPGAMGAHNRNARCFMAIEIERSGSRKHMMGGAVNAAALGRLGGMVACSEKRLRALLTIRRYQLFLLGVGKTSFDTTNLLIVTARQIDACLRSERTAGRVPNA